MPCVRFYCMRLSILMTDRLEQPPATRVLMCLYAPLDLMVDRLEHSPAVRALYAPLDFDG